MSYGGYKVPTLYAITWEKVNDFIDLEKNTYLYSHLATNKEPSKCFIEGKNTKYKNTEQKKSQYKKDVKKANIKRE
jgi:hypothetical protein